MAGCIPRRVVMAGLLAVPFLARPGRADDLRISHFDIGAGDEGWRIMLGKPAVPPPPQG